MSNLETMEITCPYCGEIIEIVVDKSPGNQEYIEDCEVCCKPITFRIQLDSEGTVTVFPSREDDL